MDGKKKHRWSDVVRIVVLLIGIVVLLYPTISNYLYEKNSSGIVDHYDDTMEKMTEEERLQILEKARQYNAQLVGNTQIAGDTFNVGNETTEEYARLLSMDKSGMMGYIIIPEINVELPVYHTTKEAVLQKGVGHLPSSSLPVGGESTHTVLTGHRGLPSRMLFTDLDQLENGDVFYLKVFGETLAYQVDRIVTVLPKETDDLQIEAGKDYATLITCTPYAINTHRLLVRGKRIPYEEAEKIEEPTIDHGLKIPFEVRVLLIAVGILFMILIGWRMAVKRKNKRRKKL